MRSHEIYAMLLETGLPVAYRNWVSPDGGTPPPRPYLIYYRTSNTPLCADDSNYASIPEWCVELYTDLKDEHLEALVANTISSKEIAFTTEEIGAVSDAAPLLIKFRFQTI